MRLASVEAELAKVGRELTQRVHQVKSLEDHAAGLESSLNAEKQRTSELVASLADLTTELAQEREALSRLEMQRQHENQLLATRIAELAQERDAVSRLETERQRESESLAGRLAKLERERDALSRLEAEQQRENQSLAARIAELEQDGYQADERRVAFESLTSERDQLEAAVEQMRRRSAEMLDERIRMERHAAGVTLERDSLRDALVEQQRRSADDLRSVEDKLLTERGNLDFELEREREENRQLRNRVAELARVASQQAAERDLVNVAMDKGLAGAGEARRETERLIAQLNLERLNYDELAQRARQAESLLAEVLGSTSWRVTLPARRLMGALRGRDKR